MTSESKPKKTGPTIVIPHFNEADEKAFEEKNKQDQKLPLLLRQLEKGCGNDDCENDETCATANPSIKDRQDIVVFALQLV